MKLRLAPLFRSSVPIRLGAAGLLAALGWYVQNLPGAEEPKVVSKPSVQAVLMVQTALEAGEAIVADHLTQRFLEPTYLPPGAVSAQRIKQVTGLLARRPLRAGQVLTLHDLKSQRSHNALGAQILLPKEQITGIGVLESEQTFALYSGTLSLPQASLTPQGQQVRIRVDAQFRDRLASMARGPLLAVKCVEKACQPSPIKTLKPSAKTKPRTPPGLRVSYGDQP